MLKHEIDRPQLRLSSGARGTRNQIEGSQWRRIARIARIAGIAGIAGALEMPAEQVASSVYPGMYNDGAKSNLTPQESSSPMLFDGTASGEAIGVDKSIMTWSLENFPSDVFLPRVNVLFDGYLLGTKSSQTTSKCQRLKRSSQQRQKRYSLGDEDVECLSCSRAVLGRLG